jgi:hypothetical protein
MLNPATKIRSDYVIAGYITVLGLLCAHMAAFLIGRFA